MSCCRSLLALVFASAALAQSISITAPSGNPTWSGWAPNTFTVSLTNLPTIERVCYLVDSDIATDPGQGALATAGCNNSSPYSQAIDTYWWANGPHQVVATAYDAFGNVLATSSPATFVVGNNWPVTCTPAFSVSTGTSVTSTWSGQVSVSITMSTCASDTLTVDFYVDGILQQSNTSVTTGTSSALIDTTAFLNATHTVMVTINDGTSYVSYAQPSGCCTSAGEWSRNITFSNTGPVLPVELRGNARDIYLTTTGGSSTFTLSPTLVQGDGTSASSPTFYYASTNTSVATVSASTGSSVTVTGAAQGSAQIMTMGVAHSGTDGTPYAGILSILTSASYTFRNSNIGQFVWIGNQSGCISGLYLIQGVQTSANIATLYSLGYGTTSANFATSSGATCNWALGPSRSIWAQVASGSSVPPVAHFSNSGGILTTYTPGSSMVMNEGFNSIDEYSSQPYTPTFGAQVCASGFNTIESGVTPDTFDSLSGTQSAFASSQAGFVSGVTSTVAGCSKIRLFGTGDNIDRTPAAMWAATRGTPFSWSPTGIATVYSSLLASSIPWVGVSLMDEINNWGQNPLQGPISIGAGTSAQNWLSSISCNSTTCTVTASTGTPGGGWSMFEPSSGFVLHGSATSGMNTPAGNLYVATGTIDTTSFTFPSPVSSYNSSGDSGLTIEPLSAGGWFSGDYVHFDAWASLRNQLQSVSGHTPAAGSQAAGTNATAVECWEGGPCGQSITEGGNVISTISDWADIYWSHGSAETYTIAENSLNGLISDGRVAQGGPEEGFWLRYLYGSYSPSKPLTTITQGTEAYYTYDGPFLSVSSCSGNTLTFSATHGQTNANIVPGLTRVQVTGGSGCAGSYYILSFPASNTATVALAATSQNTTGSGGTIHFSNGDTYSLSSITATGTAYAVGAACNACFTYTGSPNSAVNGHRGQTFTLSGVTGSGATYFNSGNFVYNAENLINATDIQGNSSAAWNYFREIPNLSGSGGSAILDIDNLLVRGRNPASMQTTNESDPRFAFLSVVEAMFRHAAGHRWYKFMDNPQAYTDVGSAAVHGGFTGSIALSAAESFDNSSGGIQVQHFSHPSVESSYSVPQWHAGSLASLIWSRTAKFWFQTPLNSPDYGPAIDCGAAGGANGNILGCGNFSNNPQTRIFSLSPYLESGQTILRYIINWHGISFETITSGTTSDAVTLQAGDAVLYAFPANSAAEWSQVTVSTPLAGASSVVMRYDYDQYNVDNGPSYNCGSSGTCQPPVDLSVGTVYYRLIYLNSSNDVLSEGSINTLTTNPSPGGTVKFGKTVF